jgi:hypothetical protein
VFVGLIETKLNTDEKIDFRYMDYGLHSVPKKLAEAVQDEIDSIDEPSLIVMGYGLCGNGLHEINAGKHKLVIPKADDCIAIFMGSREKYQEQFTSNPGTYYLTKGWLEVGADPMSEYEQYLEKYGEEKTKYMMDLQYRHYKRLVFVAYSSDDFIEYGPRAREVAAFCQRWEMEYEEYLGNDEFLIKIGNTLENNDPIPPEFVVVQPGEMSRQDMFF